MAVDFHTHILPPPGVMPDWAAEFGPGRWPKLVPLDDGMGQLFLGEQPMMKLDSRFWSAEPRIADMDRLGIAVQVMSPIPMLSCYWAPPEANKKIARYLNLHTAEMVASRSDRFIGMGTVPLQAPDLAIEELRFLSETLEMRTVQIGTCPAGRDLDDPALFPFLQACQDLDIGVFVHPMQPLVGGDRVKSHYLPNIAGNPLETGLAITRLIVGGVLERLPKLRMCFAHAGGAFPLMIGRLDKGFAVRAEMRADINHPPSAYADRIYVDGLTFDEASLRFVVEKMGAEKVILGTDYPFGLSEGDPVGAVRAADLPAATVKSITEDNVWTFLGGAR